jgi:hypothetical protein
MTKHEQTILAAVDAIVAETRDEERHLRELDLEKVAVWIRGTQNGGPIPHETLAQWVDALRGKVRE